MRRTGDPSLEVVVADEATTEHGNHPVQEPADAVTSHLIAPPAAGATRRPRRGRGPPLRRSVGLELRPVGERGPSSRRHPTSRIGMRGADLGTSSRLRRRTRGMPRRFVADHSAAEASDSEGHGGSARISIPSDPAPVRLRRPPSRPPGRRDRRGQRGAWGQRTSTGMARQALALRRRKKLTVPVDEPRSPFRPALRDGRLPAPLSGGPTVASSLHADGAVQGPPSAAAGAPASPPSTRAATSPARRSSGSPRTTSAPGPMTSGRSGAPTGARLSRRSRARTGGPSSQGTSRDTLLSR